MIRHIVLWEFLEQAEGATRAENMRKVKAMLEALPAVIPEICSLAVGPVLNDAAPYHMALTLTTRTIDDLHAYQRHPAHRAVSAFVSNVRGERLAADIQEP
ncbi:MAG: Dabb family protein [Eubacteriales bacterium]|nr:Dabb family protein [Eubacteriales bacterium]